jgi:RNA polymerase sigma factor (sigma-70 family)
MEARQLSDAYGIDFEEQSLADLTERFGHRARFFAFRVERRFSLDPQWRDDLISSGYWGLLKALQNRRCDAHDRELSAYVSKRVEGAVIDEARRILSRVSNQIDCDPVDLDSEESVHSADFDWDPGFAPDDPEHMADRAARWRSIEAALEPLAEDHRQLLWAYAEGRSIPEIARSRGCSPGRLQSQMNQISRQIRAHAPELRRLLRHEI